ncbi:hypothetical protein PVK06_023038 [Gossypium arboreum]|uniref:Uncharacterized protein n=1 Tax=Gossypium arboreum TaxID=29729 RepID=A0ABR0PA20_GOSAR|nr:hypothetical protein PVK06_023038 [Gossypium arboreum]
MPRYKDDLAAVRASTVCDESRNVPALGCGDDLLKLFANYGDVEECKPMDAEDCKQFTDVYWIEFQLISNARKRVELFDPSPIILKKYSLIQDAGDSEFKSHSNNAQITRVSSDKDCFPSQSMNQTVKTVRAKLNKIQSDTEHLQAGLHPRKQE